MPKNIEGLLKYKGLLKELEDCHDEEEVIDVLKREKLWGNIVDCPELEALKESYKNGEIEADGTLSLNQLDKVAGGARTAEVFNKHLIDGGVAKAFEVRRKLQNEGVDKVAILNEEYEDIDNEIENEEEALEHIKALEKYLEENQEEAVTEVVSEEKEGAPVEEAPVEEVEEMEDENGENTGTIPTEDEVVESPIVEEAEERQAPIEKVNTDVYIRPEPQMIVTQNATNLDESNLLAMQTEQVERSIKYEIERSSSSCMFEELEDEKFEDECFSCADESLVAMGIDIDENTEYENAENEIDEHMERFVNGILTDENRPHNFSMETYDKIKEAIIQFFKTNLGEFEYWKSCCKKDPSNVNELIFVAYGEPFLMENVDMYDIELGEDLCEEIDVETPATVDEVYVILSSYYSYEPEDVMYRIEQKRKSLRGWNYQSFEENLKHIFQSAILSCNSEKNMENLRQISKVFFEQQLENIFTSALSSCNSSKEISNLKQFSKIFSESQSEYIFKSELISCVTFEKFNRLKQYSKLFPEYHPIRRGMDILEKFCEFCTATTKASEEELERFWQMKSKLKAIGLHESILFKTAASYYSGITISDYMQLALDEKISSYSIYSHILPHLSEDSHYEIDFKLINSCKAYLTYIQKIINSRIQGDVFFEVLSEYETLLLATNFEFPSEWMNTRFVKTFNSTMDKFKKKIEENKPKIVKEKYF